MVERREEGARKTVMGTTNQIYAKGVPAWGDGSFKPTSSGHASAPNKKPMLSLARFMSIVQVDEHGTTKNSCCCMEKALERKNAWASRSLRVIDAERQALRAREAPSCSLRVIQCPGCKTMFSRDFNAAVNNAR